MMKWCNYRRKDFSIDLVRAWREEREHMREPLGEHFLALVEKYQLIYSPEAAAIALSVADYISIRAYKVFEKKKGNGKGTLDS